MTKVDKNNWVKSMENIVSYTPHVREVRGASLAYVFQCHVKVAHIAPGYGTYLNLDKEMIARAPIDVKKLNLKMTQDSLDRAYLSHQCEKFKVDNILVYQTLLKAIIDTNAYVYTKQRRSMQVGQSAYFDVHKHCLGHDHVVRQDKDAQTKLQTSHYDGERKGWDWDKYVTLHKEQHAIMGSLTDYGYSGMDNGAKVCHFLQGIKITELEAAVNVVWAQPEKYGTDFDVTVSSLGQMVIKKAVKCNLSYYIDQELGSEA